MQAGRVMLPRNQGSAAADQSLQHACLSARDSHVAVVVAHIELAKVRGVISGTVGVVGLLVLEGCACATQNRHHVPEGSLEFVRLDGAVLEDAPLKPITCKKCFKTCEVTGSMGANSWIITAATALFIACDRREKAHVWFRGRGGLMPLVDCACVWHKGDSNPLLAQVYLPCSTLLANHQEKRKTCRCTKVWKFGHVRCVVAMLIGEVG